MSVLRHWFLFFILMALLGCSKSTGPGQGTGPVSASALISTWELEKCMDDIYLTVNKNQTVYNQDVPGQGSITVTGAETASLSYLYISNNNINVSDVPFDTSVQTYPYYILSLGMYGTGFAILTVYNDNNTSDLYIGTNSDYVFDTTSYQLTIHNLVLNNRMQQDSVTVAGTLKPAILTIPANIQTKISTSVDVNIEKHTYIFSANNGFVYIEGTDTTAGTWLLSGNTITLVTVTATTPETLTDTSVFTQVTISGDVLTWVAEENYCGQVTGACYTTLENTYGLEPGTIEQAVVKRKYYYNRINSGI